MSREMVLWAAVLLPILAILVQVSRSSRKRRDGYPLPPGPKGWPLIGNLLDMPRESGEITYREWSRKYGSDVVHVNTFGKDLVIVNSARAADDLFNKRSSLYSDRPVLTVMVELLGFSWLTPFVPYGPLWRRMRKALHTHLNKGAVQAFEPLEEHAIHNFLRSLLDTPEHYSEHLRHLAGRVILRIAYGIEAQESNDPSIRLAEQSVQCLVRGSKFDAMLLDLFPILQWMPSWFPGAGFKKIAREYRKTVDDSLNKPWDATMTAKAEGIAPYSIASAVMKTDGEEISKSVSATLYLAGADTTVVSSVTFVLAMVLNPDIQKKAQDELDSVLGGTRLPTFADQDSLPYVSALVKEIFRWHPAGLLGIPHKLGSDDIYNGYLIPAGSTVIGNIWAILHDPETFPDPDSFRPEHFISVANGGTLAEDAPSFPDAAFGFGRRICPGRYMAYSSTWLTVAAILATFDIGLAKDDKGHDIPVVEKYTDGIVSYPAPFKCSITPRSEAARAMVVNASIRDEDVRPMDD